MLLVVAMFGLVIGGIYFGIFHPTPAGAIGVFLVAPYCIGRHLVGQQWLFLTRPLVGGEARVCVGGTTRDKMGSRFDMKLSVKQGHFSSQPWKLTTKILVVRTCLIRIQLPLLFIPSSNLPQLCLDEGTQLKQTLKLGV